ncbi:hypothetical protein SPOG_05680 [Schizosaccharomyces cryophilus OY26]|uniref:Uncharacterized protein n=1 Tax=Schizosaccharomyces cryophilus (strain OY26 / ATCC MYA-4695 / CBS 11777 / NBRC 106824 / NRRL Y48691) TaxID=653667 RepID=S9XEM1_SCHCR|nr:uncharacterized protein SPOG_05680 [Schizosaccharomyces cryophilus OY26]EPY52241.1 hypothetical protein SPOG_05680 [Schizosaccharomyces cryophilus OY26]
MNYYPYIIDSRESLNRNKRRNSETSAEHNAAYNNLSNAEIANSSSSPPSRGIYSSTEGEDKRDNRESSEERRWWKFKINKDERLRKLKENREFEKNRRRKSMEDIGFYFY